MCICYTIKALLHTRLLRKIDGAKREEITDGGTNCIKRNAVICTRHQALLDQIEEGEMNDNCESNGENKNAFRI